MARFILSAFADEAGVKLDEQILALKGSGVRGIEIRNVEGKSVKDLTYGEAQATRERLDNAGISVMSMGSPFGKIGIKDDFEQHMEEFRHALQLCHILGTETMRVFSFYMPKGEDPEDYRGEVIRRLSIMLDEAEREGVKLAHENEKGIYADTGDRSLILMEELGDRLGLIFDPANFIQCGCYPAEEYPKLEGYITYMHIKDAVMGTGAVVPCGKGDGALEDILSAISKRSGDIVLSVEPHLAVFKGLEDLQKDGVTHLYEYKDQPTAFMAAVSALKETLNNIGYKEGAGVWTL